VIPIRKNQGLQAGHSAHGPYTINFHHASGAPDELRDEHNHLVVRPVVRLRPGVPRGNCRTQDYYRDYDRWAAQLIAHQQAQIQARARVPGDDETAQPGSSGPSAPSLTPGS
jgi:hypothetical protein